MCFNKDKIVYFTKITDIKSHNLNYEAGDLKIRAVCFIYTDSIRGENEFGVQVITACSWKKYREASQMITNP